MEATKATCDGCGRQVKAKLSKDGVRVNLPRGWRRIADQTLCNDQHRGGKKIPGCISQRYYVRAFRVQIVGLAEAENDGRTMEEFRAALSAAARESARYGNWLVQRLFAADPAASTPRDEWPKTKDGKPKLPPMPAVDSYAPQQFPLLSGATISALSQMVTKWYGERRFEAFAALSRTLDSFRFGYLPIECRAADWQIVSVDNKPVFRRIAVGPGKSWAVNVWCDTRNLQYLQACMSGEAVPLAMKVVRSTKRSNPGAPPTKAWFCRVAVLLPRKAPRASHVENTLTLGHDPGSLLYGETEDGAVFELPGTDLRKIIVGGDKADRRRQQDNAHYRATMSKRKAARWAKDRTRQCAARARKVDHLIACAAAALVRWCVSNKITSVDYEVADRGFAPHFPWRALRDRIACGLEAAGVALHVLGAAGETEHTESAALAELENETT